MRRAVLDMGNFLKPSRLVPVSVATVLLLFGGLGYLNEAWGYGLLLLATVLLVLGLAVFLRFILSRAGSPGSLPKIMSTSLWLGAWTYVGGVAALSGFFIHETVIGQMELRWIIFGPAALGAIVALDWGVYRLVVTKNLPTWQRYRHLITEDTVEPERMRQVLVDDVVLHKSLFSVSGFRWFKHTLIFWGFGLMFAVEIVAVFVREGLPAFGYEDIWEMVDHPLRLAFDFAFDATGLMVLVGCTLAVLWRLKVNGTEEQKFTDTPTAVFLFLVVLSGFLLEGMRIAGSDPSATHLASFVGLAFAALFPTGTSAAGPGFEALWLIHVLGSCAFIAYVPAKRMIHSCATPMGRMMNSQKSMLAAKKEAALRGLLGRGT